MLALLLLVIPGFLLNNLILGKKRAGESFALSWLTGSVIFSLALYILNLYFNIKLNLTSCWLVFLGLTSTLALLNIRNLSLKISLRPTWFWLFIPVIITSLYFPVTDWDAVTLFDFRARVLLDTGFIGETLIRVPQAGYPMYTSMLHFWTYLTGFWTAMPIYPLFTVSLAAGVYFATKKNWLVTLACLFAPKIFQNSFVAYTNMPYTVFLILGAVYIYHWTQNRNWRDLLMGILLSATTFWIRSFPFAVVNFTLILLAIPFVQKYAKYLSLLAAVLLISTYFVPALHSVANYLKWSVYEYYSPYWLIFIGLFIYSFVKKSTNWFWPLLYLGYSLVLVVGTYYYYQQSPTYYLAIPDAIQRMSMFLNLVVVWFLFTTFSDEKT